MLVLEGAYGVRRIESGAAEPKGGEKRGIKI